MKNLLQRNKDIDQLDELPNRSKMVLPPDGRDFYYRSKFPYRKVQRFLESRVGENWDNIFSEYVHLEWVPKEFKTFQSLCRWNVETNTFLKDGNVWCIREGSGKEEPIDKQTLFKHSFYIHPTTKKLCRQEYKKQTEPKKEETFRILGNYHQFVKVDGMWYEIKGEPVKSKIIEIDGLHYKPTDKIPEYNEEVPTVKRIVYKILDGKIYVPTISPMNRSWRNNGQKIGPKDLLIEDKKIEYWRRKDYSSVKITLSRQLNHKDLKKYGLKNDVKPIFGKRCEVCGNLNCQQNHTPRCPICGEKFCRIHKESAYYTPLQFYSRK